MTDLPSVILSPGREKPLLRRHPWVFSGAVDRVEGDPAPGATVGIRSSGGDLLGWGAWSPRSQIRVRVWTFPGTASGGGEPPPGPQDAPLPGSAEAFFRDRLRTAVALRRDLADREDLDAYRLVNAESDGLPGLIVDRYGSVAVCQLLSAGPDAWREAVAAALADLPGVEGVWERSDADARGKEGLEPRTGALAGAEPPDPVEIREGPCRYLVDVREGHKTGFYLDQRESREAVAAFAPEARTLNCFSYTGAFGIRALAAGARSLTNVEASAAALELGRRNVALNGLDASRVDDVEGNAFGELRRLRKAGRRFDLIVLDPPRFADSRSRVEAAARGYKDINLQAFHLLEPGGALFTFSCSGHVGAELFQKIVADAAVDAGREGRIVRRLAQGPDHPVGLGFPEGEYLKGVVVRVPG